MSKPNFLIQQSPRMSIKESEKILDESLEIIGIILPSSTKHKNKIIKIEGKGTEKENKKEIKYIDLAKQVRNKGTSDIQSKVDSLDPLFRDSIEMSSPNWQINFTAEWAGYKKKLKGPFRNVPSEYDLSDDIQFYKDEACFESSEYNFEMVSRNYRGFLFSSIALIDSYINRHILFYNFKKYKSDNFIKLTESKNTEHRLELFINEFCNFNFSEFIKHEEWSDFKRLKTLRNEVIHSLNPFLGISLQEISQNLNLSINGIGTFLKVLQMGQNRHTLTFIERVRTSPVIHFNRITIKENGKYEEKLIRNKISR